MANIFANALSALAKVMNNGVSTFTFLLVRDQADCPKEMQ